MRELSALQAKFDELRLESDERRAGVFRLTQEKESAEALLKKATQEQKGLEKRSRKAESAHTQVCDAALPVLILAERPEDPRPSVETTVSLLQRAPERLRELILGAVTRCASQCLAIAKSHYPMVSPNIVQEGFVCGEELSEQLVDEMIPVAEDLSQDLDL